LSILRAYRNGEQECCEENGCPVHGGHLDSIVLVSSENR